MAESEAGNEDFQVLAGRELEKRFLSATVPVSLLPKTGDIKLKLSIYGLAEPIEQRVHVQLCVAPADGVRCTREAAFSGESLRLRGRSDDGGHRREQAAIQVGVDLLEWRDDAATEAKLIPYKDVLEILSATSVASQIAGGRSAQT